MLSNVMATQITSSSSSSPYSSSSSSSSFSSSNSQWIYDVFLSFRGEDTRTSFTDHLYDALDREGIFTFRDDEELKKGKPISPTLLQAIKESRIALVVLSRNYASSTWCLDELAQIVDCMKNMRQTVLPIFYDVDPSEVRKQTGRFAEAFAAHEERFKDSLEKVRRWRAALTEVANISGFDLQDRHESEFIKGIIENIVQDLNTTLSIVPKDLVGIDSRVEEIKELCFGIEKETTVGFMGIWGMGGIGKTTLAQAFFEKVSNQFQAKSFVNNVREASAERDGLVSLQKKLLLDLQIRSVAERRDVNRGISEIKRRLCRKKVLIVLDDVDKLEQLEALAGSEDWFGQGSRIIITTRDEHLLIAHGVEKRYKAKELKNDEALKLFSWKAFKNDHPPMEYMELSSDFVDYVKGLPLAIEVLGPFLCRKSIPEWQSAFRRLKGNLEGDIMRVLQIGFDGLHEKEKQIFLDIACFFKGKDKDHVTKILDSFDFEPIIGIRVLIDKSLITVVGRKLWMHDLLQEMGWEIVRQECPKEPGRRSRLWHFDDVFHVLKNIAGTEAVEGMVLNSSSQEKVELKCETFSMMKKLRFLKICDVLLPQGLNYLSTELRVIEWHGYPLKLLPQDFPSRKLVELIMCCSHTKQLWTGYKALDKLKSIELSDSESLTETPDLSGVPNLERMILQGCTRLYKVHPSVGILKRLKILNMKNCTSLGSLLDDISMESLETLILSGCLSLKSFPKIVGDMNRLSKLYLDGTAIQELPSSIERLTGLILLDLSDCKNLLRLPNVISKYTSLKTVILSGCSSLKQMPENIGSRDSLEELDVSGTAIRQAPPSIRLLKNLKFLSFSGCKGLLLPSSLSGLTSLTTLDLGNCNLSDGAIPNYLGCLSSLRSLDLSGNNFTSLPNSICKLSKLRDLSLNNCTMLQSLPTKPPISLLYVWTNGCTSLKRNSDEIEVWSSDTTGIAIISRSKDPLSQDNRMRKLVLSDPQVLLMIDKNLSAEIDDTKLTCGSSAEAKIPEWFENQSNSSSVTIELLTEVDIKSAWMGFALYFGFVDHEHDNKSLGIFDGSVCNHCDPEAFHKFSCHFDFNEGSLKETFDLPIPKVPKAGLHGFWVRIPRACFSKHLNVLNELTSIEASITTNSPSVEVNMSAARLLYEKESREFAQVIRQCTLESDAKENLPSKFSEAESYPGRNTSEGSSSSRTHLPMLVEDQGEEIYSTIPLKERLESLLLECYKVHYARKKMYKYVFPGGPRPFWFMHHSIGWQVSMDLPPNLYDDKRWIGFSLYVSFADHDHPFDSYGNLNSDFPFFFFGFLDTSGVSLDPHIIFPVTKDSFNSESHGLLLFHVPREFFSHDLNRRHNIRASFGALFSPTVQVERCGIRLVYEQDLEEFIDLVVHCILRSPDSFHQLYYQSLIHQVNNLPSYAREPNSTSSASQFQEIDEESSDHIYNNLGSYVTEPKLGEHIMLNGEMLNDYAVSLQRGSASTEYLAKANSTSFGTFQRQGFAGGTSRDSKAANVIHVNVPDGYEGSITDLAKSSLENWHRQYFHEGSDQRNTYNDCFPQHEIPEWFCCHNGPSSAFRLLPNSQYISDWKGIALCAAFAVLKHPTLILDNLNSDISHSFFYLLETNTGLKASHRHQIAESKFNRFIWLNQRGFIWISFIPCGAFEGVPLMNNCSYMKVIFKSNSQDLLVRKCGHRLVFHQNVEDFVQTIMQCSSTLLDNPELNHQSFVAEDSRNKQSHEDFRGTNYEVPYHEISRKTNLGNTAETREKIDRSELVAKNIMKLLRTFCQDITNEYLIYNSCFPPSDIPLWFSHLESGPSMSIQLPPNLNEDTCWAGFALCASFSVSEDQTSMVDILDSQFSHHLICLFEISGEEYLHVYPTTKEELKWLYLRGFNWLSYVPRRLFSSKLNGCNLLKVSILSDCPGIIVRKFGFRTVYLKDGEQLSLRIPLHCAASFFDNWDLIRKYAAEKDPTLLEVFSNQMNESTSGSLPESFAEEDYISPETFLKDPAKAPLTCIRLMIPIEYEPYKTDLVLQLRRKLEILIQKSCQDFEPHIIHNSCFPPSEILEWFSHYQSGPSATIPLPPGSYDDNDWMGLVLCASFSVLQDTTAIHGNLESKVSHNLMCHLEPQLIPEPLHVHCTTDEDSMWLYLGGLMWISYIPRDTIMLDQQSQCSLIEASFNSDFPGLGVEKCGLRLLYRQDMVEYKTAMIQGLCLLHDTLEYLHQILISEAKSEKQTHGNEGVASGTGYSYGNSNFQRLKKRSYHGETSEAVDSFGKSNSERFKKRYHGETSESGDTNHEVPYSENNPCQKDLMAFDRNCVYDICFPRSEIIEWFNHYSSDHHTIQLPQNLFSGSYWVGLAVCASFFVDDHPIDLDNSEASHYIYCHLQTDENGSLEDPHTYRLKKEDMKLLHQGGLIWICYIPQSSFSGILNECNGFDASIASDHPSLLLQKCGFRLVNLHDEEEFKKLISHFLALMTDEECINQSMVDVNEQNLRNGAGTSKSGSSTDNLDPEKTRPNNDGKGKGILEH